MIRSDFDGDEMNLHVPQDIRSRVELQELMHVNTCLLSAAKNCNTMGIVQDSLLACYLMTAQECFIEKARFFDLIFSGIGEDWDGKIPIPAILYPEPLWTGKQLLSMLLPDISMNAYDSVDMNDEKVCIRRGNICTGRFNKKIIGKGGERGLIHRMILQEGQSRTAVFMSNIQFVANDWMVQHSFSTGIEDCSISEQVFKKVRKKIFDTMEVCSDVYMPEGQATTKLNRIRDIAAKYVLDVLPANHGMMNMIKSGSKGSNINIAQIAAAVGQQMVNGKRISCGNNDRTSAHFHRHSPDPVHRGFVWNSYMSGLSPKEFFCRKFIVFIEYFCTTNTLFVCSQMHKVEGSKCSPKCFLLTITNTVCFCLCLRGLIDTAVSGSSKTL